MEVRFSYFSLNKNVFGFIGFENYLSTFAERLELGEYVPENDDQQKACGLVLKK